MQEFLRLVDVGRLVLLGLDLCLSNLDLCLLCHNLFLNIFNVTAGLVSLELPVLQLSNHLRLS